jgi:hypothetical protein
LSGITTIVPESFSVHGVCGTLELSLETVVDGWDSGD